MAAKEALKEASKATWGLPAALPYRKSGFCDYVSNLEVGNLIILDFDIFNLRTFFYVIKDDDRARLQRVWTISGRAVVNLSLAF
jgi:hypothetical protein